MKKEQIILLVVGLTLVILLYTLPRAVVENEPELEPAGRQEEVKEPTPQSSAENPHVRDIPQEALESVSHFQNELKNTERKEKSATFADSLASLYFSIEQYDSSAKYAELALDYDFEPDRLKFAGEAYYNAWIVSVDRNLAQSNVSKAQQFFEQLLERDSSHVDVKVKYAMTFVSARNPMKGILMLREVSEKHPDNEQAQFNLGALSMQSGQYDKAVDRFDNVIRINPGNIEAKVFKAVSLIESGKRKEAKQILTNLKGEIDDPEMMATIEGYLREL